MSKENQNDANLTGSFSSKESPFNGLDVQPPFFVASEINDYTHVGAEGSQLSCDIEEEKDDDSTGVVETNNTSDVFIKSSPLIGSVGSLAGTAAAVTVAVTTITVVAIVPKVTQVPYVFDEQSRITENYVSNFNYETKLETFEQTDLYYDLTDDAGNLIDSNKAQFTYDETSKITDVKYSNNDLNPSTNYTFNLYYLDGKNSKTILDPYSFTTLASVYTVDEETITQANSSSTIKLTEGLKRSKTLESPVYYRIKDEKNNEVFKAIANGISEGDGPMMALTDDPIYIDVDYNFLSPSSKYKLSLFYYHEDGEIEAKFQEINFTTSASAFTFSEADRKFTAGVSSYTYENKLIGTKDYTTFKSVLLSNEYGYPTVTQKAATSEGNLETNEWLISCSGSALSENTSYVLESLMLMKTIC
jgi:hypothetical protein